jgi:hypothetical protein
VHQRRYELGLLEALHVGVVHLGARSAERPHTEVIGACGKLW